MSRDWGIFFGISEEPDDLDPFVKRLADLRQREKEIVRGEKIREKKIAYVRAELDVYDARARELPAEIDVIADFLHREFEEHINEGEGI